MATVISGDTGVSQVQNNIVSPAKLTQPLTLGIAQNTTSGTSIDFTGIPSWVKRITVNLISVSTNGSAAPTIQVGTSTGLVTTGYIGTSSQTIDGAAGNAGFISAGFDLRSSGAAVIRSGSIVLTSAGANMWVATGVIAQTGAGTPIITQTAGYIILSGSLDRLRLTTANGTDAFDAGSVNILYEG